MSKVNVAPAGAAKKAAGAMTISIADIAKHADVDGDGDLEPEEKEIIDTLKSMDVDGDGTISLKELVNLGGRMNEAKKNAKFYKRLVWGVLLIAMLAMLGVFVACIAAVEATKDSRPEEDGTLKTTVVGGASKVVSTGVHKSAIKLVNLNSASFSTLRGISDLGFKVGNRFYQYTITGFEQDFNTDGSASVRLFTSRGDSIYVAKETATLEKASGTTVDIAAASIAGKRHLLQDLLPTVATEDKAASEGDVQTTTSETKNLTTDQVIELAGDGVNEANATGEASNTVRAFNVECPDYMIQVGTEKKPVCACEKGFLGAVAYFDEVEDKWVEVGECEILYPAPESKISIAFDDYEPVGAYFGCAQGYRGTIEWSFKHQNYTGVCSPANMPNATNMLRPFDIEEQLTFETYGNYTVYMTELYVKCPDGYTDMENPLWYDYNSQKWSGKCKLAQCPPHAYLTFNEEGQPEDCHCKEGYFGPGYTWEETDEYGVGWQEGDLSKFCTKMEPGLLYDCDIVMNSTYGFGIKTCASTMAPLPDDAEVVNGWTAGDEWEVSIECVDGFKQSKKLQWHASMMKWGGECAEVPCFGNATLNVDYGWPMCKCNAGYELDGEGWFDSVLRKYDGKCKKVKCPEHSASKIGNPAGSYFVQMPPGECICKPGFNGGGYVWDSDAMEYTPRDITEEEGCERFKCPPDMIDESEGGVPQCACPDGYNEVVPISIEIHPGNGQWEVHGQCVKHACPNNTVAVDGTEGDKSSYCKCDSSKGLKGPSNWWYPAQYEYMTGNITEQAARAKVESENQTQQWYANCTKIKCPDDAYTHNATGKCYCPTGKVGKIVLDAATMEYYSQCDWPELYLKSMYEKDYDSEGNPMGEAVCYHGFIPTKPANLPFKWDFAKQTYVNADDSKVSVCKKKRCPSGTYDTDLTFISEGDYCMCQQNGIDMTMDYGGGMIYPKYASWDEDTMDWMKTKADCW